ncbi:MAG: alkaline phosphatase D family protein [Hyphomicrobium sp.]|jgi:alkaline phosphatase D
MRTAESACSIQAVRSTPRKYRCAGAAFAIAALLASGVLVHAAAEAPNDANSSAAKDQKFALPLSGDTVVERIAFGSCLHQAKPQVIWRDVLVARPQLLLMLGDNVYGDFKDAAASELAAAYDAQQRQPEFRSARTAVPMLAIWDDHDFGKNDGGAEFPHKRIAAELFHRFWGTKPERPAEEGLYYSRTFGVPGKSVQLIMLDTRSFRSLLKPKSDALPFWGRYEPDPDPSKTILGPAQWAWLEAELAKPADLRIIASSIQVLSEGHGWERWGNFPVERDRLLRLLVSRNLGRVILLSGDRHSGAIYVTRSGDREIVEMTASALNMVPPNPSQDARVAPLASDVFTMENFGMLAVDWQHRTFTLSLIGLQGRTLAERRGAF